MSVLWTADITLSLSHYKGNVEGGLVRNVCMGTIELTINVVLVLRPYLGSILDSIHLLNLYLGKIL